MKKFIAVLLACVMLFSVAFAFPMNFSIMPRTGFFNSQVSVAAGKTWTSYKYEISSEYKNVYLDADLMSGGSVTVELYGSNSTSTTGTKLGSLSVNGLGNYLSAKNTYRYYHFKVINDSSSSSSLVVKLYA
ncbi:MAG: hypothetical protein HFF12_01160 [Angelakisella sp.]|nr:hypothetical protein [Angelakisella sp.]